MKPIELNGLTVEQVKMLDHMWSMDTAEEITEWQQSLSPQQRAISQCLQQMVMMEALEQLLFDNNEFQFEAQRLLSRFRLH